MSKNEARLRKQLFNLARWVTHPRSHHAAIIVKDGKVICEGANSGWVHAEQAAINEISPYFREELRGATLYTMMVRAKSGTVGDGTPCPECMRSIRAAGIRKVVVYI